MRKDTKKVDVIIIAVIVLIIAGVLLLTLMPANEPKPETVMAADTNGDGVISYKDYIGKKIGIITGTNFEAPTLEHFPDSEYLYFNSYSDIGAALTEGRIDGFLGDEPTLRIMRLEQPQIGYLSDLISHDDYAFGFPKNSAGADDIRQKFDEMMKLAEADGTLDVMKSKWFGDDEEKKTVDLDFPDAENGTLSVVTTSTDVPFSYIKDNKNVGYSIELVAMFCRRYGYTPVIEDTDFSARIPGLTSGKYDMCASSLTVTEERKDSINFSEPIYNGGIALAVRSSDLWQDNATNENTPLSYYADKRIGILTGSAYEPVAQKVFPDAEYVYFDVSSDLALATLSGMIDGYLMSTEQTETMTAENPGLFCLNEAAEKTQYAFAFPKTEKGAALRDKVNAFLAVISADGTLDALHEKWTKETIEQTVDMSGFTGENGELHIACDGTTPPWEFVYDGELTGYEIELVTMFCREYGYTPVFDAMNFAAVIPGIASEKYDMAAANITVTPERAESVYFSDAESGSAVVFVTTSVSQAAGENDVSDADAGFFEALASSFEKNFIREDRWKLIVDGIGTTCFITVLSALFGSVLAFLVCMFRRTGSRLADAISNIYVKLLQGTPIVVLLMILYYVVLGKSGLEAVWVAVIGFSLNFGAYASEIMRSGIESIDGGQREAALALGYNENQAFFRFIFPQAAVRFTPVYKQEIVSLLKSTSIVGYIAIQDLTKMSDIIRSRTYEAFFPLIVTAIIYFILAWIISLIVKLIMTCFDKRSRRRKVKGHL